MANNILKEAIADAKAVREVALANAKAALEEAFTPKLQSMLSAKLSEELEEEYYDEDENADEMQEDMYYDEDNNENMDETSYEDEDMDETYYDEDKDMDEMYYDEDEGEEDSMDEEIDLEEILNELELEGSDEEEESEELEEVHSVNPKASDVQRVDYGAKVNESKDFNLDSLLREINDLEDDGDDSDLDETLDLTIEDDELTEMAMYSNEAMICEMCGTMHEGSCGMEEMDMDEMDMYDEDMDEMDMDEMDMDEMDMNEMDMYDEDMDEMDMYMDDDMMMETKKGCGCKKENTELYETKSALKTIRTELNEVNLLNSKLLYVNRIFKTNNLDEGQKLRVVETLDKAESVKEAKLIYETVKDTFTISKKKKTNPNRSIRENFGMASKATLTSAPRKSVLNESNDMVARMQKLANISKIK